MLLLVEMVQKTMAKKTVLTQIQAMAQNCTVDLYFSLPHTHGVRE